jgi:hypothetical protein
MVKIQDFTRIILDQRQDLPPTTDYSLPYLSYLPFIFHLNLGIRFKNQVFRRTNLAVHYLELQLKSNQSQTIQKKKIWHRKNSNMISN